MASNFFLNNIITYRDMRLRGRQLLWGWMSFVAACSVGALANVGIADYLFQGGHSGWFLSALAGILVGAVWNYAVTAVYISPCRFFLDAYQGRPLAFCRC